MSDDYRLGWEYSKDYTYWPILEKKTPRKWWFGYTWERVWIGKEKMHTSKIIRLAPDQKASLYLDLLQEYEYYEQLYRQASK